MSIIFMALFTKTTKNEQHYNDPLWPKYALKCNHEVQGPTGLHFNGRD